MLGVPGIYVLLTALIGAGVENLSGKNIAVAGNSGMTTLGAAVFALLFFSALDRCWC